MFTLSSSVVKPFLQEVSYGPRSPQPSRPVWLTIRHAPCLEGCSAGAAVALGRPQRAFACEPEWNRVCRQSGEMAGLRRDRLERLHARADDDLSLRCGSGSAQVRSNRLFVIGPGKYLVSLRRQPPVRRLLHIQMLKESIA